MTQNVNAEIISIGTEILLGEITDTNSVHIARALRDIGVNIYFMTSVGDNENRITNAIESALSRADVIITTGGLGPTVDDMTRQGVARATGRDLVFHQSLLDAIAERFAGFRANMTENNSRQAYLPADSILVENPVGTAPCFVVDHKDKIVISLPGVPREMKYLLAESIIPFLHDRYQLGIIKAHILRVAGIGESSLDDMIETELLEASNPTVGLAAHSGVIDIRITAKAADESEADGMIEVVAARLRDCVGSYIFGSGDVTIAQALVDRLAAADATMAISETGIRQAVSDRVRAVSSWETVLRQVETHETPAELPGYNGDLRALALQVAEAICRSSDTTVGIAVISNPEQAKDQADSEVGTAVAVHVNGKTSSRVYGFGSNADEARVWTGTWALSRAWRMLQGESD